MKKFVSILVSLALVLSFASIGLFASELPTTTITYEISPSYMVVIPSSVSAGSSLTIGATSINNRPGEQVVVKISDGISQVISEEITESYVTLNRQTAGGYSEDPNQDGTNVLAAKITLGGETIDNTTPVARFHDGLDNLVPNSLLIAAPADTTGKLAGTYKGTLTFSISCESIPK